MSKHTPGPWNIATEPSGVRARHIVADTYTTVCSFLTSVKNMCEPEEINANARLIAAAPDLLEAVKGFWQWAENQSKSQSKGGHATFDMMMLREQQEIAANVIKKATGEQP